MSTTVRTTYGQFDAMIRRGDFEHTDDRFELLFGEICIMPLPKPKHEDVVDELNEWSIQSLPHKAARVRVQQSLGIPALDSLTLPDIAWMKRRDYSEQRPLAEDVLLLIEVSESTLSKDRKTKGKIYARAGIREYWIVNTRKRCVEVRRDPEGDAYRTVVIMQADQEIRPLSFPAVVLPISRLFPS